MEVRRCMKCMHPLTAGETVCPECGRAYGSANAETFALKPGTILEGKYLVGEMLGQGGFGITYIGFDLLLEQKVAIKEYYPMSTGMVSRDGHSTVVWSSAMMGKTGTQKGFDSFLKEARKMAKLGGIPGVVGVKSVFIQNETAYIVMDFIEGETLLKKLQKNGPMDFDSCVKLMTPIMQALAEVHEHGITHRDISPNNIMVQPDGKLILLDLGAAKDLDIQGKDGSMQSSQMVAKQGFSPIEQYWENGNVGPWTDVYAMAATIYYCCTGVLPPSAVGRVMEDSLTCQPLLTQAQFDVLAFCMSIMPQNRPQDMTTLLQLTTPEKPKAEPLMDIPKTALSPREAPTTAPPTPNPEPVKPSVPKAAIPPIPKEEPPKPQTAQPKSAPKPRRPLPRWLLPAAAAVVIVVGIAISVSVCNTKKPEPVVSVGNTATEIAPVSTEIYVMVGSPSCDPATSGFWGQNQYKRKDVIALTFQGALKNVPVTAWDVSEARDRSVLAWMVNGNLHVAADGMIAPSSAANLFANLKNLQKIDFGDCFDTSKVTDMSNMFLGCSSLTELDLSGFDTTNVTNTHDMFYGCDSLTSLICGDSKILAEVPDSTSVSAPAAAGAVPTNVYVMMGSSSCDPATAGFWGQGEHKRKDVTTLTFLSTLKNAPGTAWDVSEARDRSVLAWMVNGNLYVAADGRIAPSSAANLFANFKNLREIDFGNCFDTSKVTDMSNMFLGCSSLTELDLSSLDTSNVTNTHDMFYGCNNLTDLICNDPEILAEAPSPTEATVADDAPKAKAPSKEDTPKKDPSSETQDHTESSTEPWAETWAPPTPTDSYPYESTAPGWDEPTGSPWGESISPTC